MRIDHIAIWVSNLEKMKNFYVNYFKGTSNDKYINPVKKFESYFISFDDTCRIELMHLYETLSKPNSLQKPTGLAHFSISVGGKNKVNELTEKLRADGYTILSNPRTTGDGCYESVMLDPEGNEVEICE